MSKKNAAGLKPFAWILVIIQLALSVFLLWLFLDFDLLPDKYLNLLVLALTVLFMLTAFLACFKRAAAFSLVISILLSAGLGLGSLYFVKTKQALKEMSSGGDSDIKFTVLVKAADSLNAENKLSDGSVAVVEGIVPEYTAKAEEELLSKWSSATISNYSSFNEAYSALTSGEVDALLLFEGFRGLMEDANATFSLETSIVTTFYIPEIKEAAEESSSESQSEEESEEEYVAGAITQEPFCVLCMGSDFLGGGITEWSNHDVNILIVVNPTTKVVLMVSTPRDFYVDVPYSSMKDKLTHAGSWSGNKGSMTTIGNLYDITISRYILAGFDGFIAAVDALGGIDVYSEVAFQAFGSGDENGLYQYEAGVNHLNGAKALAFCRERHNLDALGGDRQRGKNQMAVIKAIAQKVLSPEILANYLPLLNSVSDKIMFNFTSEEIAALVKMQLHDMASWHFYSYSVNGNGTFDYTASYPNEELYVMVPDESTVALAKEYIQTVLNGGYPEL